MDTTARCPHGRRIGSCGVCASTPQPPSPSVSLLPAALKYAGHGLPVFPLVPGGKTPLTAHGFKDATTDTTKICEWFSQWPDANIGMPTTAFTALDVDTKNGHRGDETLAQLEAQHGALPETVKQRTWSGGIHYLFLSEPGIRNSAGSLGAGLDVRGEGGYIVVSPSVVNGTPYQWLAAPGERPFARMPQWLIESVTRTAPAGPVLPVNGDRVREGQRNTVVYQHGRSMAAKGLPLTAITAALLALNTDFDPPLPEQEVIKTAEHCVSEGHRSDYKGLGKIAPQAQQRSGGKLSARWAKDIEQVPIDWLYEDAGLAKGKVMVVAGDPGLGKTLICEDLAARISAGAAWPTEGTAPQGNVLLIELEDGESDQTIPRLRAHGADESRICVYGPEHGWVEQDDGTRRAFSLSQDIEALKALIVEMDAQLVVISPLMSFVGGTDIKSDSEVRRLLDPVIAMAAAVNVAVIAVIHLNKNSDRAAIHRVQGSIAFVAGSRLAKVCGRDPNDRTRFLFMTLKPNYTPDDGTALAYRIQSWCLTCNRATPTPSKRCPTCKGQTYAKAQWESAMVQGADPDTVLGQKPADTVQRSRASQLLADMVPDHHPVLATKVYDEAEKRGINKEALSKQRYREGVESTKGDEGRYVWYRRRSEASPRATPGDTWGEFRP